MAWLYQRKTTGAALGITVAVFLALGYLLPNDGEYLARYAISASQARSVYLVLLAALVPLALFEPSIRSRLRQPRLRWSVLLAASAVSFFVFQLLIPVQEKRLFDLPFSLWLMLAHAVVMCALAVILVTDQPLHVPDRRLLGSLSGVFAALCLVMAALYAASVGEFMPVDTPDEPWTASVATTFADFGRPTTTYLASAYGDPDVVFPRLYYLFMGLWGRLAGSTDLYTLRLFPLGVGALVVVVLLLRLRQRKMSRLEAAAMVLALLASMTFLRTTHNLRMDIMIGLYGACVLWGFLRFCESDQHHQAWAVILGAFLLIGTQGVPPVAVSMGIAVGLVMIVWAVRDFRSRWAAVMLYAGTSALALLVYYLLQFLPDIPASLQRYQEFTGVYTSSTGLGTLRLPFESLAYIIRFSLVLSPAALGIGLFALALLLRRGTVSERAFVVVMGLTLVILFVVFGLAYMYFVVFAPATAYAVGRLMRWRVAVLVGACVLLPALVSPPIHDLWQAVQARPNGQMLANDEAIVSYIPEQVTLVGDDRLWFTLHQNRRFIGWNGLVALRTLQGLTQSEVLLAADVKYVICSTEYASRCNSIISTGLFTLADELVTPQNTYSIYRR